MWDPAKYLTFADHRSRPFHELVARIGATDPRRVVDLGCGPGNLTETLPARWPEAVLEAFDSSPEMVAAARARGLDAHVADAATWTPAPDTDVVVTNAVLQWLPTHPDLLRRWVTELPAGAWLAMQVPGNFDGPSHSLVRELVRSGWNDTLGHVLRDQRPVLDPAGYADLLADCEVDAWETTYLQRLEGPDAVLEWITGTALRPIRATLDDQSWEAFRAELAPRLRAAYPQRSDGTTWFPFRRVFAVARVA
ncbi:trans-aconitate 2-methyltransferase [Umezawaea tangerina]|uniref:Trans-aconitate 2-methyltransferase n=1 Tax=Umezawaea tangerina TaxID=84725 RepID=A0A2T0SRR9_9PSEU|nr:trans-aconitate 2-methyltransferase [Umezawaea tangerina]PRY36104.1 trans-aconitate 2-methyltransferase [Umezawaea tangerina]